MKSFAIFTLLALLVVGTNAIRNIPEKFLGKWALDRSENFDEYLSARGVSWFVRKMINLASVTKTFEKASKPNTYTYSSHSSSESVAYQGFTLGVEFQGKGFDGLDHLIKLKQLISFHFYITFNIDGDTLTEKHIRINNPDDKGVIYRYNIENGELVLTLQHESITCRRFFKRQ